MATEWYRRKSWTAQDQEEFFGKLSCALEYKRPQYLKVQAIELAETGQKSLIDAAEFLINKLFKEFPEDRGQKTSALKLLGDIYNIRKEYVKALEYYKQSIELEKTHPGITQAYLDYSELVIKLKKIEEFSYVESILLERKKQHYVSFPIEEYKAYSILAIIYKQKKDHEKTHYYSNLAEIAASKQHSEYRYHKNLGLVKKRETWIEKFLKIIK